MKRRSVETKRLLLFESQRAENKVLELNFREEMFSRELSETRDRDEESEKRNELTT